MSRSTLEPPTITASPSGKSRKAIRPGTDGWTIADFANPEIDWPVDGEAYELVDGVLRVMSPFGSYGGRPANRLRDFLVVKQGFGNGEFFQEMDLVLRDSDRTARPDFFYLTPALLARQTEIERARGLGKRDYRPIFVPPALVVESISIGHERHDRVTKRRYYAEAAIPHYWILDAADESLECLVLEGTDYRLETRGVRPEAVKSAALGGIEVPLDQIWPE